MKRSGRRQNSTKSLLDRHTVGDFCDAMESFSPVGLAQSWDNVGLIVGNSEAALRVALLAIDLTAPVLSDAIRRKADLLLTYHPPIFKPVSRLLGEGSGMESLVFEAIQAGIALYSPHTALDAANGGTNEVLAGLCGATRLDPLVVAETPGQRNVKIVVYVPVADADRVADAMFAAGAGHIGKYSHCSFRAAGQGTFLGGPEANPTIGKVGRLETVNELRLETIVPQRRLADVVASMRRLHPYEEPAFDLFDLRPEPVAGIGRIGHLPGPVRLAALAQTLGRKTGAKSIQTVGEEKQFVERVITVAGAAGSLPFQRPLSERDCIVTGEMRHHDALTIRRIGCSAIVLGHWWSERPVLGPLAKRLSQCLPSTKFSVSKLDADPFQ